MNVGGPEQRQAGRPENVLCFEFHHPCAFQFVHAGGGCPFIVEQGQVRLGGWVVLTFRLLQPLVSILFHISLLANNSNGLSVTA
jgi:hypothetical protein